MIKKIRFKNYKSFKDYQELELKPMTIIIGKNSSGKSAITKLPVLIDNSFNNVIGEPFTMDYDGVQFGDDYRDLFYGRIPNAVLEFEMTSAKNNVLNIKIVSDFEKNTIPNIYSWHLNNTGDFNYSASTNNYKDAVDGKEYLLTFEGFNLDEIRNADGSETDRHLWLNDIVMRTDYIGPFRVYANSMRTFQLRTFRAIDKVGVDGTDAYYILGIDSLKSEGKLVKAVSDWYKANFDGWGLTVNNNLQSFCKLELTREDKRFNVNIADAGQGMSQALPLVVNAHLPGNDYLTIMEQPELHLHPAAHGNLAQLFAEATQKLNKRYLIETHSQNFVLRLRRMSAEGKLNPEDLQMYWVDYDAETNSSSLKEINVNASGEVDFWPENIFSETLDETLAIRTAQLATRTASADKKDDH